MVDVIKKRKPDKRKLYEIVRDRIVKELFDSNLKSGDRYASELELTQRFSVSRNTVRRAMSELEESGFIIRRQRLGAIVTSKINSSTISKKFESKRKSNSNEAAVLVMVLPSWELTTGSFITSMVLQGLREGDGEKIKVDLKHHQDNLDDLEENVHTFLIVDPKREMTSVLEKLVEDGIRVIAVETSSPFHMAVNINFKKIVGCKELIERLYSLGHREIGLYNSDITHDNYRKWHEGYIEGHRSLGLKIDPLIMQNSLTNRNPEKKILERASAWICTNWAIVNLLGESLHKAGLKVPRDISIVGSDDPGDVLVSQIGCKLSVLRPDFLELGRIIRQVIKGKIKANPGDNILCPVKYIERESVSRRSP